MAQPRRGRRPIISRCRSAATVQNPDKTIQPSNHPIRRLFPLQLHFFAISLLFFLPHPLSAATPAEFAARARLAYQQARAKHTQSPKDLQLAWQFGRACYDVADFSTNNAERESFAEQGIAACNAVIAADRNSAPAHYYLGMNLGQLAQTRGLGALKIVDQMEAEFKTTRQLDENFDYAGPDRNLGLLYRDAPSWISVGSRSHATKNLLRAAQLAPGYPENRLNLLESYLKWDDHNGIKRELKLVDDLWPRARKQFTGIEWELSWADWTDRLQQAKKKIKEPSRAIESPRGSEQP